MTAEIWKRYQTSVQIKKLALENPMQIAEDIKALSDALGEKEREVKKALIHKIEEIGIWGQVPHINLSGPNFEKTMWCLEEKDWKELQRQANDYT